MSAAGRTGRRERRRRLGQNFLCPRLAESLVARSGFHPADRVVEIGPGLGAFTAALARRGVRVVAVELDPELARTLRVRLGPRLGRRVEIVRGDFLSFPLPREPFRVVGSLPFGDTTRILRRLLEDPGQRMERADLVLQWEVARKRAAVPPTTLLSATWAPWWELDLVQRIPASAFTPAPRVDAAFVSIVRRRPALLPVAMARAYARFVRARWPFEDPRSRR